MTDPLNIVHSEAQPAFEELREQYREANRQRIHANLREDYITFRGKDGRYLTHPDGSLVVKKTGYLTDAPDGHEHQRLDDYIAGGGSVPDVTNMPDSFDLVLNDPIGLQRELRDLERDSEAMRQHERVRYRKWREKVDVCSLTDPAPPLEENE